jgi:hypothetical protein
MSSYQKSFVTKQMTKKSNIFFSIKLNLPSRNSWRKIEDKIIIIYIFVQIQYLLSMKIELTLKKYDTFYNNDVSISWLIEGDQIQQFKETLYL